ncbi:MAG: hypothetical protein V4667_11040 [Bacteroidota bacterium]
MDFKSIDEIISHFDLDVSEADEIKRELKSLIKKVHPDKNHGSFKSDKDKDFYMEIQSALEFLESGNTSLATKNDITALAKVLKDLAITRKEEVATESIEKKNSSLTVKLQDSITDFHRQHSTPKITSLVITTIITALWAFPTIVKDHPLLGFLYQFNGEFTIIWITSLFAMGMLWTRIKTAERKDEAIKKNYKLESTQNAIFTLFTKWLAANLHHYEIREKKRYLKFSKDDLISFLTTRFNFFQRRLRGNENLHRYEIEKLIKEIEESKDFQIDYRKRNPFHIFFRFLPNPGEIDLEIAQMICDLIIDRLNTKGVITKSTEKSLSDIYEFEEEY